MIKYYCDFCECEVEGHNIYYIELHFFIPEKKEMLCKKCAKQIESILEGLKENGKEIRKQKRK